MGFFWLELELWYSIIVSCSLTICVWLVAYSFEEWSVNKGVVYLLFPKKSRTEFELLWGSTVDNWLEKSMESEESAHDFSLPQPFMMSCIFLVLYDWVFTSWLRLMSRLILTYGILKDGSLFSSYLTSDFIFSISWLVLVWSSIVLKIRWSRIEQR